MSDTSSKRPAFTLRFRKVATHRALRLTAHALGVSMSDLAESAIEHELALVSADLERKLSRVADLLRFYRDDEVERDVAAFARAEVTVDDPLRSRQAALEDAYGVGALFADSMER